MPRLTIKMSKVSQSLIERIRTNFSNYARDTMYTKNKMNCRLLKIAVAWWDNKLVSLAINYFLAGQE